MLIITTVLLLSVIALFLLDAASYQPPWLKLKLLPLALALWAIEVFLRRIVI